MSMVLIKITKYRKKTSPLGKSKRLINEKKDIIMRFEKIKESQFKYFL